MELSEFRLPSSRKLRTRKNACLILPDAGLHRVELMVIYFSSIFYIAPLEAFNHRGRISIRCPPYHFDCDPSRPLPLCVPIVALRNCRVDCPNKSDECCGFGKVLCDTKLRGLPCGRCVRIEEINTRCRDQKWKGLCEVPGAIKCSTTQNCVLPQWILDGKDDCGDGSDEEPCRLQECTPPTTTSLSTSSTTSTTVTTTTAVVRKLRPTTTSMVLTRPPEIRPECEVGEFRCLSGECVDAQRVLDGVQDCFDKSDEKCRESDCDCTEDE